MRGNTLESLLMWLTNSFGIVELKKINALKKKETKITLVEVFLEEKMDETKKERKERGLLLLLPVQGFPARHVG